MNILIFSWRGIGHPFSGGAELVTHQHAKAWVKAGHKVTLFTSYFPETKKEENVDGVRIIRKGNQILGVHVAAFMWYLFQKKEEYDLVIDHFHGIPFFTPLFVREKKLAVIQETTREIWFLNLFPIPLSWLVGIVGYLFEPFIFLLYKNTLFMAGSKSAKDALLKFNVPKRNVKIIHHGVNIIGPSPTPSKEKETTIMYLGALSRDKGIEGALKCFSYMNTKGDYQFWVIGRPDTEKQGRKIKEMVKKLKLERKVKFWGFVNQKMKFILLAKGHVLINPSVREGWGLVNIEANAMGTPVVGYEVAGVVDSVRNGKTGYLVEYGKYKKLAEKAMKLTSNKKVYRNFQKNCKDWASNFRWEDSTKQSLKLIESM